MPITRTPWVDDDGTGTTGTVINNAEKTTLYNQIDASAAFVNAANTFTGNQKISKAIPRLQLVDTAQPANARHFELASTGQEVFFQYLNDAETVNTATPLRVSLVGNVYAGVDLYEKSRVTPIGHWIAVPFSAANFLVAGAGSWTVASGNVAFNHYTLIGKTMLWTLMLQGTTVASTPNNLIVNLPSGITATTRPTRAAQAKNPGVVEITTYPVNTTQMYLSRNDGLFAAGTTDLLLTGVFALT